MTANGTKTAPELLRELDIDKALAERARHSQSEIRERRIALIGRLWRRRRLLARFCICGALATALIAVLIPSQYRSTARLMPPDPPQGQGLAMLASFAGKVGGNLGALGGDLLGIKTSADLFAGVLSSRSVQDEVVGKFDLRRVYGFKRVVDARKELSSRTDVSIDRKSGIMSIQVTDHDPNRACAITAEYISQLNRVVTQLNTSSAQRERVFLEQRLGGVKLELEAAEKDFSLFASRNAAIDIKEQGKAMVEAAAVLEGQMIAAQTELQGLRTIYTDNNVRVRAAEARIDEFKRELQKLNAQPAAESADSGSEKAGGKGNRAEPELYPSLRKLPLLGVTYADLYRRAKVQETLFELLTQQYELAKVQEAKELPSVKVLDAPDVPEKKVFPPRTLLVLAGTLLSLFAGVFWVCARDGWRNIDPQDPGKLLVLEMFSSVTPPFTYATEQRFSLSARARKFLDRWSGGENVAETKR